ncbi:MAG: ATP-dependent DNA helicase, partial [Rhodospirillales bacterium]|nr:ATP-dependent DNA helicase [Rhodospirillales bacterium]
MSPNAAQPRLLLPPAPVLVAGLREAVFLFPDGEIQTLPSLRARRRAEDEIPIVCHRLAVAARLKVPAEHFAAYDALELFAFVRPARFCLPTVRGLAEILEMPAPGDLEAEAFALIDAVRALLHDLTLAAARETPPRLSDLRGIAWKMARGGWNWGPAVLAALGVQGESRGGAPQIWERLPEWYEQGGEPPAGSIPVDPAEARARLAELLGPMAEQRPQQADYASASTAAFQPRQQAGQPNLVLAEAGTGTGKTLGYIAPASLWARKNGGPVWISTYTRNLQRQLDNELDRLFPDPAEK